MKTARLLLPALAFLALLGLPSVARAHTVEVTASGLNVRSGPSSRYRVLGVARRGERLETLGRRGSWVSVRYRGQRAWAYGRYLRSVRSSSTTRPSRTAAASSNRGQRATVTAGALNVRSGPSTRYRVVGRLRRGAEVTTTSQQGSWYRVALRSGSGWVHGGYLSFGGRPGASTPTGSLPTSRVGFVQLPNSGPGFYGYYAASKRWGTPRMVYGIMRVARRLDQQRPGAPRLGVGDLSLRNGGDIAGHASHERGVDADFRPLRNDGREGRVTIHQGAYSRSYTQSALDLFVAELPVTHIFFNDRRTRHTQYWPNHDNHFHVRIRR